MKGKRSPRSNLFERQKQEVLARQARFRSGVMGLWDRLGGTHKHIQEENERDYQHCLERDQSEKDQLIAEQLAYRYMLRHHYVVIRQPVREQRREIDRTLSCLRQYRIKVCTPSGMSLSVQAIPSRTLFFLSVKILQLGNQHDKMSLSFA